MSATSFDDLMRHRGHTIEIVNYGSPAQNIVIECLSCSEVLVDYDKEETIEVELPKLTDSQLEDEYSSDVCCWGCGSCGEWIACDYGDMREHLEVCEEYKKKILEKKK